MRHDVVKPQSQGDLAIIYEMLMYGMAKQVGSFTMAQMGQSKSVVGEFMKQKRKVNPRVQFVPPTSEPLWSCFYFSHE